MSKVATLPVTKKYKTTFNKEENEKVKFESIVDQYLGTILNLINKDGNTVYDISVPTIFNLIEKSNVDPTFRVCFFADLDKLIRRKQSQLEELIKKVIETKTEYNNLSSEQKFILEQIKNDNEPSLYKCPICSTYYDNKNVPKIFTSCGHIFCKTCIEKIHKCSICNSGKSTTTTVFALIQPKFSTLQDLDISIQQKTIEKTTLQTTIDNLRITLDMLQKGVNEQLENIDIKKRIDELSHKFLSISSHTGENIQFVKPCDIVSFHIRNHDMNQSLLKFEFYSPQQHCILLKKSMTTFPTLLLLLFPDNMIKKYFPSYNPSIRFKNGYIPCLCEFDDLEIPTTDQQNVPVYNEEDEDDEEEM